MKTIQIATALDDVAVVLVSQGESGTTEVFEDGARLETVETMAKARAGASRRQVERARARFPEVPEENWNKDLTWRTEFRL